MGLVKIAQSQTGQRGSQEAATARSERDTSWGSVRWWLEVWYGTGLILSAGALRNPQNSPVSKGQSDDKLRKLIEWSAYHNGIGATDPVLTIPDSWIGAFFRNALTRLRGGVEQPLLAAHRPDADGRRWSKLGDDPFDMANAHTKGRASHSY